MGSYELYKQVQDNITGRNIEDIVTYLDSITTSDGPIHPNNEEELSAWNIAGGQFLREGKFSEAERIYRALYGNLLKNQVQLGRLHKGLALHNLAISLFFQGKTSEAIKFFVCAYSEDVIRTKGKESADRLPASGILIGLCGVPQPELYKIKEIVLQVATVDLTKKSALSELFLEPEKLVESEKMKPIVSQIQQRYTTYLPNTWKWESDGQTALKNGEYTKSFNIYSEWFTKLIDYQKVIYARVHKGHPLFNAGVSATLSGKQDVAFGYILLAYIEDVLTAANIGDADDQPAFKNLAISEKTVNNLKKLESAIFVNKQKTTIDDPREIVDIPLSALVKDTKEKSEEDWKTIISASAEREACTFQTISKKRSIDETNSNILQVLKRWNSATPCFPNAVDSFGGGYFLIWNNMGIVIDPGYDFLELFYKEGYFPKNIDLIIVTHAHDDHCYDLEAYFSTLHKIVQGKDRHEIDLILSEGAHIKYGRLLTVSNELAHVLIMKQDESVDPQTISGKNYQMKIQTTQTMHNENPWMKNNTGFGLLLTLYKTGGGTFKIGLTSDTIYWDGMEKQFSEADLLIEHIGTVGVSKNHLTQTGCMEIAKKCSNSVKLVVISEFGDEQKGRRESTCRIMENSINNPISTTSKIPVLPADIGLKIKIPSLEIFCNNTEQFEDLIQVTDKEVDGRILYLKRD